MERLTAEPAQFSAMIEELRYRYHKWDAYVGGKLRILPEALVITEAEHQDAVDCCVRLHQALEKASESLLKEPGLVQRLGIPGVVQEIIAAELPNPRGFVRYDLIPTASGWMVPEFNEDAPGGLNESVAGKALFGALVPGARVPGELAHDFLDAMPAGRCAGLVYATGYAEDLQHMLILAELLRKRGIEPVLASPSHLTCGRFGRPRLLGKAVDWILRFFPGEWYAYLDNIRDWRRTVSRIPVVNPLSRLLRQSKGLYVLWRNEIALDESDRAVLNRYTPHTEFFGAQRVPVYVEERERWCLKKLFGRMGDAVTLGRLCTPAVWETALAEACKTPQAFVMQHAFVPLSLANDAKPLFPALGVYLLNGAFAGYYSRVDEVGFTTHEACYVVTAIQNS